MITYTNFYKNAFEDAMEKQAFGRPNPAQLHKALTEATRATKATLTKPKFGGNKTDTFWSMMNEFDAVLKGRIPRKKVDNVDTLQKKVEDVITTPKKVENSANDLFAAQVNPSVVNGIGTAVDQESIAVAKERIQAALTKRLEMKAQAQAQTETKAQALVGAETAARSTPGVTPFTPSIDPKLLEAHIGNQASMEAAIAGSKGEISRAKRNQMLKNIGMGTAGTVGLGGAAAYAGGAFDPAPPPPTTLESIVNSIRGLIS